MNIRRKILTLYFLVIILIVAITIPTFIHLNNKVADAITVIEERQVEEGKQHTAIVEAHDVSNELLIMDNGHEIDASELSRQPVAGDVLSYTKTFGYVKNKWTSMPKKTSESIYINIKIMN